MTEDAGSPIKCTWDGDHLNRVEVAKFLTAYLNNIYLEGNNGPNSAQFVLNLNASWGQGKTFLLKRWAKDLDADGFPVVIFDAWENDFSKDPLVGFMSELYEALDPWLSDIAPAKAAMKKVKKSVTKVISAGVGIFAGGAAAGLTQAGLNMLTGELDVSDGTSEAITGRVGENAGKLAERALKEHKATKQAIAEFKKNLEALIKAIEGNNKGKKLPLYIFIDELDRCRPTYAIELLENIKHLFGVEGVFFVVATNKEQLAHSIKAVYGNSFDAFGYLGRFFDQEYTLPEPDNKRYAKYLLEEKYQIANQSSIQRFFSPLQKKSGTNEHITDLFAFFADAMGVELRDQGQIAHRLKAIMLVTEDPIIYLDYLLFLLMLKKKHEEAFNQLFVLIENNQTKDAIDLIDKHLKRTIIDVPKNKNAWVDQGNKPERVSSLISQYYSQSRKTSQAIMEDLNTNRSLTPLENQLFNEASLNINSAQNGGTKYLSIAYYPKLVSQVGHLE